MAHLRLPPSRARAGPTRTHVIPGFADKARAEERHTWRGGAQFARNSPESARPRPRRTGTDLERAKGHEPRGVTPSAPDLPASLAGGAEAGRTQTWSQAPGAGRARG